MPRGIPAFGFRNRRRTKAEMQAARGDIVAVKAPRTDKTDKTGKRHRRTKAEMQAFRAQAPDVATTTKGKRHRRTKAEMQAFRASLRGTAIPATPVQPIVSVPSPRIMEPVQPSRASAPTVRQPPAKVPVRPDVELTAREFSGRALHATSLLSFLPWVELSRGSREEFCVEAEKNACL